MRGHVAVLMGGLSAEREVSLVSGKACADALERQGWRTTLIDVGHDLPLILDQLRPDRVFNALHGRFGEDGRVQGLLDILRIPYTHSGVLPSAVAMHKPTALRVFADCGMRTPPGREMTLGDVLANPPMDPPFVIKPVAEGSSVRVFISIDGDLGRLVECHDLERTTPMRIERFIPGRELTCAVLGNEPLAVTEIRPRAGFYDYTAKYTEGLADHLLPAPLPAAVYERCLHWAATAHRALGCRGVSRADFRFDDASSDGLYLLELNTQPGMTPLSLVPEQAAYRDITFDELVLRLIEEAQCDA